MNYIFEFSNSYYRMKRQINLIFTKLSQYILSPNLSIFGNQKIKKISDQCINH